MQYHPDVSKEKDSENKFKEVNEANEVLSDDQKRQQYDKFGHGAFSQGGGNRQGGNPFGGFGINLEDMFSDAFSNFPG